METPFSRQEILLGPGGLKRLRSAHIAVFGLGGVGGNGAEALVRCGVGQLTLVDGDVYAPSNLNRQLFATIDTVGCPKVEAAADRLRRINPDVRLNLLQVFYTPQTAGELNFSRFDYILDAVDMVSAKLEIIQRACEAGVPMISAMGAGNKLDPAAFQVADIYETSVCPLARVMRRELRKRGIERLKVVYSREEPRNAGDGSSVPGSVAFVPPVMGLIMAGEAVKDLCGEAGP